MNRFISIINPKWALAGVLLASGLAIGAASAQTADYPAVTYDRLTSAQADPGWLTYYRSYTGQSNSPLKQINTATAKDLQQVWSYKFPAELQQGFEATPIVNGNYMFVTTPKDHVYAFDAKTGKELWTYDPKLTSLSFKTACCDVVNRGVALYGKNVYVAMLSGQVVALDAQSGKVVWEKQLFEPGIGYAFTLAPLALKDSIIVGSSGGEYGARGFIAALNPANGEIQWKRWTVPAPNEKGGNTWPNGMYQHAGSPAWLTGTYDVKTNTLFWGVGNPGPWLADMRPGKNLYSDSLLALDPANGDLKWHFQYTSHDTWDYDGVNTPVLANITYKGKHYEAIIHADRNGYIHAIDRTNGKLIYAKPFVKATSVTGYTAAGVPIQNQKHYPKVGTTIETCPSFLGGKNWWSVSYDPTTHLAFVPSLHACMTMSGKAVTYMQGLPYLGEGFEIRPEPGSKGYGELQAIDVNTGKKVWSHWSKLPWNGGVASTAGGLVFSGSLNGHLYAFDQKNGKVLWESPQLASGVIAQPSVFEVDGTEYVAVLAGYGGANPIWGGPMAKIAEHVPRGGTLYVFALKKG
ncbi:MULTISPECIES: methanol/ethanol family PQQ-dependent dehydrogenase [Pandoraea]|uniref:Pyrrolo-quinoline quinone n=1 Tax=Pandoraea thiooxydans TaxID=445709 RepID=A0A0G3EUZ0_9BURK|nr:MULTISPECIES: methanol/ethanol family PQQ-dependent dehydrogenase [Pandoraea]MDE2287061.1 methanol/ethanol family PQQ-dependent dehydrogenase [Burkholderiales bacterium]AKJ69157.1 pyrrolo-quinoline quinone [Pandoraea thiooxydans]APR96739.1 pyrrolo-quinoline quinone [Pandoraea thiooxydans]MDE2611264.1 methanol/ethanol family PQQ-dependent dehydrogenase [Burkholderiales bacterium]TAL55438.1 MAG: PQQ-dependent dehydrogenase, methanol/ethanol family [Pandoraea sp.]